MANSTRATLSTEWTPRLALEEDIAALEQIIPVTVRALQAGHYSPAQMEAALGPVFGADRRLILAGEPLYASCGHAPVERYEIALAGGVRLPIVRMTKRLELAAR